MGWCITRHYSFIDFEHAHPFSISSCNASGWDWTEPSLQSFPVEAKRVVGEAGPIYRATLWALCSHSRYDVKLTPHADGEERAEAAPTSLVGEGSGDNSSTVSVSTLPDEGGVMPYPEVVDVVKTIMRSDFFDYLLAHPRDYMLGRFCDRNAKELTAEYYYQSLFALPIGEVLDVFIVPNARNGRYCLDLEGNEFPWFKNKKVRRLVSSGRYAVAVNRDPEGSLRSAREYHVQRSGGTWLNNDYIKLLTDMFHDGQLKVQLLAVELVEKSSGTVVAGCLGFGVGSVFHDFTMFTLQRTAESYGTVITKVMGAALQACGYNMWLWGNLIKYMEQYAGSYGARCIGREEFLRRWALFRDQEPKCRVGEYLRSGKGLLKP